MADIVYHLNIHSAAEIPDSGIISRTLLSDDNIKVVLFGFDKGQELSEHTASVPATIHILEGEADVTIGAERSDARPGFWAWMPANMPHSIVARTKTVMLLYMVKAARGQSSE
ncbi:MAG: cupin domain-containing protein [Chthonomonadales bacterium]|nr:cupin domain-containing protein [Chthonomonadales bacterium]